MKHNLIPNKKVTLHITKVNCMLYNGYISTSKKYSDQTLKLRFVNTTVEFYGIEINEYVDDQSNTWFSHYHPDIKRNVVYKR